MIVSERKSKKLAETPLQFLSHCHESRRVDLEDLLRCGTNNMKIQILTPCYMNLLHDSSPSNVPVIRKCNMKSLNEHNMPTLMPK
jgi:hypothetical protein